jgi:hypothetical protein
VLALGEALLLLAPVHATQRKSAIALLLSTLLAQPRRLGAASAASTAPLNYSFCFILPILRVSVVQHRWRTAAKLG